MKQVRHGYKSSVEAGDVWQNSVMLEWQLHSTKDATNKTKFTLDVDQLPWVYSAATTRAQVCCLYRQIYMLLDTLQVFWPNSD